MLKKLTILFLLFACLDIFGQQPAYFKLGENQFTGLKVFDIIQDFDHNYYFATNEGIVKYDFMKYTKVENNLAKSVAYFNLTINKFGTIYFNNLNNQIFAIKDGKCKLFYELNAKESSNLVHLTNDDKGNLLIGCKGLVVLDTLAKVVARQYLNCLLNTSYQINANSWIYPSPNDTVFFYSSGKIGFKKIRIENEKMPYYKMLHIFDYRDSSYALDLLSKALYTFNKSTLKLSKIKSNNFFNSPTNARMFITKKMMWSPSSILGINFSENGINGPYQTFFQDCFISDVYLDHEGNVLIGTFDKGVLVIPNMRNPDVVNPFFMDPMISLLADKQGIVYLGSNKGNFYVYNKQKLKTIPSESRKSIEGIYGSEISDYVLFDDGKTKYYNRKTGEIFGFYGASLKDVAFISPNEMYLGTNIGIFKIKILANGKQEVEALKGINIRVYSLVLQMENGNLYTSTANGLYKIYPNGTVEKIQYLGKDIFSEKIIQSNGSVYVISREQGILVIDKSNKISTIKPQIPNKDEYLKNILMYKNTIVGSTSNGLYQFDLNGLMLYQFHSSYGFSSKKIYNFTLSNNDLWVSHSGGVQKIDLLFKNNETELPKVVLHTVSVNNQIIDFKAVYNFNYTHRKFEFTIYSPTLKHSENIKYHYKLEGYDELWQVQGARSTMITYNALLPGKYRLLIKAENLGKFSPTQFYAFTISGPIYAQLWFILSAIALFILVVYLIYKRQLNAHQKKLKQINELNESKLTAIQSQMNPHFIFNSLNSIQDLVLKGDIDNSYTFITKFSNLVRKTLNYSDKDFIEFEQEVNLIEVYLSLEKLRFKEDLEYTITTNQIEGILMPPMLVQPFIENALVHGLLHKEGKKSLTIAFDMREYLTCTITDNGVGRVKSTEIKQRQHTQYESFSSKAIHKRFEILKQSLKGDFGYKYIDLYENNLPTGTQVVITIPVKRVF